MFVDDPQADTRCPWANGSEAMATYHDTEWGIPSHDDRHLFEMIMLEGAQAGLSWSTILNKRENYRDAFDGFDPAVMVTYDDDKFAELLANPGIVRNRLKVASTVKNARAFLAVQDQLGSFADYLWEWVDGSPIVNHPTAMADLETHTDLSDRMSKDLKKRGFTFVGTTIVYSFLEAVGVIDDHIVGCPSKPE